MDRVARNEDGGSTVAIRFSCSRLLNLSISIVVVVLASCGDGSSNPTQPPPTEDAPWLWVECGGSSIPLGNHEQARPIQDDIVAVVQGLWESLGQSGAVEFRVRANLAMDLSGKVADDGAGSTVSYQGKASLTVASTPYRMYKNREGVSGIEEAVDEPTGPALTSGPGVDWARIEADIRERMFPEVLIRGMFLPQRND